MNRVDIAKDGIDEATDLSVDFYFGANAVDDSDFDETGKGFINGYTTYWDGMMKKNGFTPITFVVRDEKKLKVMKKKLVADDDEIKNIGLVGEVIQGASMSAITYEDLSDEDKEDVDCGLVTVEELAAAMGGQKAGERISEIRFKGLNARKKNVEDTSYTTDDMHPARIENDNEDNEDNEDEDDIL